METVFKRSLRQPCDFHRFNGIRITKWGSEYVHPPLESGIDDLDGGWTNPSEKYYVVKLDWFSPGVPPAPNSLLFVDLWRWRSYNTMAAACGSATGGRVATGNDTPSSRGTASCQDNFRVLQGADFEPPNKTTNQPTNRPTNQTNKQTNQKSTSISSKTCI